MSLNVKKNINYVLYMNSKPIVQCETQKNKREYNGFLFTRLESDICLWYKNDVLNYFIKI